MFLWMSSIHGFSVFSRFLVATALCFSFNFLLFSFSLLEFVRVLAVTMFDGRVSVQRAASAASTLGRLSYLLQSTALVGRRGSIPDSLPAGTFRRCFHCAASILGLPRAFPLSVIRLAVHNFSRRACSLNAILGAGARLVSLVPGRVSSPAASSPSGYIR